MVSCSVVVGFVVIIGVVTLPVVDLEVVLDTIGMAVVMFVYSSVICESMDKVAVEVIVVCTDVELLVVVATSFVLMTDALDIPIYKSIFKIKDCI